MFLLSGHKPVHTHVHSPAHMHMHTPALAC